MLKSGFGSGSRIPWKVKLRSRASTLIMSCYLIPLPQFGRGEGFVICADRLLGCRRRAPSKWQRPRFCWRILLALLFLVLVVLLYGRSGLGFGLSLVTLLNGFESVGDLPCGLSNSI